MLYSKADVVTVLLLMLLLLLLLLLILLLLLLRTPFECYSSLQGLSPEQNYFKHKH